MSITPEHEHEEVMRLADAYADARAKWYAVPSKESLLKANKSREALARFIAR